MGGDYAGLADRAGGFFIVLRSPCRVRVRHVGAGEADGDGDEEGEDDGDAEGFEDGDADGFGCPDVAGLGCAESAGPVGSGGAGGVACETRTMNSNTIAPTANDIARVLVPSAGHAPVLCAEFL